MGYSDKTEKNTSPQEWLAKEWGLPCSSEKKKRKMKGTRRIRILIPINDTLLKINEQENEAGEHWSLLICDIQASAKGVEVQFGHFDSFENSNNSENSDIVADKIHEVSFLSFLVMVSCIISLT